MRLVKVNLLYKLMSFSCCFIDGPQRNIDDSQNLSDSSTNYIDNEKFSINTILENHSIPGKSIHLNKQNEEYFDLKTYKKFLLFLKFQEMMDKYNS